MGSMKSISSKREARFATVSLVLTIIMYGILANVIVHRVYDSYFFPHKGPFYGGLLYLFSLSIVFYASMLYHVCLIGNYRRKLRERMATPNEIATVFDAPAPSLAVLIPSYKEERPVIWQTMMSAALSHYPSKRVVLLIDNPVNPKKADDIAQLEDTRNLPRELQTEFKQQAALYMDARDAYQARHSFGNADAAQETEKLADLYDGVAGWLVAQARAIHRQ